MPAVSAPPRLRRLRRLLLALLAGTLFLAGCLTGSAWPVVNFYARVAGQDVQALLSGIDLRDAREELRGALRRHAGLGPGEGQSGVERLLGAMADDMAEALVQPGALERLARAREEGLLASPHAAAPPLQRVWPGVRGLLSFDVGPARGQGGFGFDLTWWDGAWRAVRVTLLDAPVVAGLTVTPVQRPS